MSEQPSKGGVGEAGSVSREIPGLKDGDREAIGRLWRRYSQPLVELARCRLSGTPRFVDGAEDVAVEAFLSFWRHAAAGDFKEMVDRRNVWGLLARITVRKAFDFRRAPRRREVGELSSLGAVGFEGVAGDEPEPEFVARVSSLLELLPAELREVALLKMKGYTNEEIAGQRGCALRKVERQLALIRGRWRAHVNDP